MKKYWCSNCKSIPQFSPSLTGKVAGTLLMAAVGKSATRNPWVAGLSAFGGLLIGHAIDREIEKRCPDCGTILSLLSEL